MSSMLEQAIIDAEQLKETAQKAAEEAVVEKYQDEIKEAIEKILEQEEPSEEAAMVTTEGDIELIEDLPSVQVTEDSEIVEIDLDKLEEMMQEELKQGKLDITEKESREDIIEEVSDEEIEETVNENAEDLDEEIELDEENLAAIIAEMIQEDAVVEPLEEVDEAEELEEEAKPDFLDLDKDGDKEEPMKKAAKDADAVKESKLLQKENKSLLKEQKRAERKVHMLQEKVDKYGTVIKQLKEKLNESNLTNAKLLYQNRILNSVSLNERQKDKIVEAISNANSVEEAKLIFETLQSAVGVSKRKQKRPESLNEVVTRSSSAFIPRKEVKPSTDAFSERMKRLAGLK